MNGKKHHVSKKAVALRYDAKKDVAPRVVAKGERLLAERIIEIASQHGVYVHEDPDLVEALVKLDVDTRIPEELYRAVAEILAFVYRLNRRIAEGLVRL